MKLLRDLLIVSRANIQLTSLPTAAIGMTLAANSGRDLVRLTVLLYVILFFTLLTYACNLNCLSDLGVDEKYKKRMSEAVRSVGIPRLKFIMGLELAVSAAIIVWLAVLKHNPLFLLAGLGILGGTAYSAPPLRIKKRGVVSFLPVLLCLYFLPVAGGWFLMTERLSLFIMAFAFGYASIMQGITFINMCEDYREDEASQIKTLAHVIGVRRTLSLGAAMVLAGGTLDFFLILGWRVDLKNMGATAAILFWSFSLVYIAAIVSIFRRLYRVGRSADCLDLSKKYAAKMPVWFFLTRYSLLAISLIIQAVK